MTIALSPLSTKLITGKTVTLEVVGMKCAGCVSAVEKALLEVPGVERAIVNLVTEIASVECDASVEPKRLSEQLTSAGFPSQPRSGAGFQAEIDQGLQNLADLRRQQAKRQARDLAIAITLLVASSLGHVVQMLGWTVPALTNDWLHGALALATLVVPGRPILVEGFQGLRRNAPNMNTLIALGAMTAFVTSAIALISPQLNWECFFDEPVMLIGFILLGRTLEQRARNRAASALQALAALQPKTARVVGRDKSGVNPIDAIDLTSPIAIALDFVQVGDWVQVLPGEQVPVDGEILAGITTIDESMLTGEPMPVSKELASSVSSGTLNLSGAFVLRVQRVGQATTLAQIIQLVETAQSRKAPIQKLADTVAGYFTYGVLAIATLTFCFWYFVGSQLWPELGITHPMAHHAMAGIHREAMASVVSSPLLLSLKLTIAVLVIACPCALGLATPTALLVGSGIGAERGLLIRGGDVLEKAFKLDTIVFDKTGTLTTGQPTVVDVLSLDTDRHTLLQLAATVESGTQHPLARAILQAAQDEGITYLPAADFQTIAGSGIAAQVQWQGHTRQVRLGTLEWLASLGVPIGDDIHTETSQRAAAGNTVVALAMDQALMGLISISDRPRPEAKGVIKQLQQQGLTVIMLTGDRRETALAIAADLGIAPEHVRAGVPPAQKAQTIAALQKHNTHLVAMVGDGINDAPALAQADVGIALQTGTAVATETADILLMRNSLTDVVAALTLSRATFSKIRQNLFWAFAYNIVAIPIAAGVLLPGYHVSLSPSNAGLLMALSSISVVSNSLLLRWGRKALV
jgi:P-type Cu2+ transporter